MPVTVASVALYWDFDTMFGTVHLLDLSQWDFGPKFAENAYKQSHGSHYI